MGIEDDKRSLQSQINQISSNIADLQVAITADVYQKNAEKERKLQNEIDGLYKRIRALRSDLERLG